MSEQTEAKLPLMQALEEMGMMPPYIREYRQRIATLEADLKQSRERAGRLEVSGDAVAKQLTCVHSDFRSDCPRCKSVAKWNEAKGTK